MQKVKEPSTMEACSPRSLFCIQESQSSSNHSLQATQQECEPGQLLHGSQLLSMFHEPRDICTSLHWQAYGKDEPLPELPQFPHAEVQVQDTFEEANQADVTSTNAAISFSVQDTFAKEAPAEDAISINAALTPASSFHTATLEAACLKEQGAPCSGMQQDINLSKANTAASEEAPSPSNISYNSAMSFSWTGGLPSGTFCSNSAIQQAGGSAGTTFYPKEQGGVQASVVTTNAAIDASTLPNPPDTAWWTGDGAWSSMHSSKFPECSSVGGKPHSPALYSTNADGQHALVGQSDVWPAASATVKWPEPSATIQPSQHVPLSSLTPPLQHVIWPLKKVTFAIPDEVFVFGANRYRQALAAASTLKFNAAVLINASIRSWPTRRRSHTSHILTYPDFVHDGLMDQGHNEAELQSLKFKVSQASYGDAVMLIAMGSMLLEGEAVSLFNSTSKIGPCMQAARTWMLHKFHAFEEAHNSADIPRANAGIPHSMLAEEEWEESNPSEYESDTPYDSYSHSAQECSDQ